MDELSPQTPEPVASTATKNEQADFWRFSAELIKTIVIVGFLAYLIRAFAIQPFLVDGSSMTPSFQTNNYLLVDKISFRFKSPERGEVIVFKYPLDTSLNYIKRVIALPGEEVHLEDGHVRIVNSSNPQGLILNEPYLTPGNTTLPTNGQTVFTVPADQYFVLGDNRHGSSDSREWGFLPSQDIIGRVLLRAYPFNEFGVISPASY